jgi:hypothetical protein
VTHYDPHIARTLIESAYDDERYAALLDRCAEITQERDVARRLARFFVAKYQFWYRRWRITLAALCAVVAGLVIWGLGRWIA